MFTKQESDRYEAIIGRDLMRKLRIDLLYSTGTVKWGDIEDPMVPIGHFSRNESRMKLFETAESLENGGQESLAQEIRESRYEPANLEEVANLQVLMSPKQKGKFYSMLKRVKNYF